MLRRVCRSGPKLTPLPFLSTSLQHSAHLAVASKKTY
jgi:hypothetical protein